jgi:hypothetical protein
MPRKRLAINPISDESTNEFMRFLLLSA